MGSQSAEDFVNKLLAGDAAEQPSDTGKPEQLVVELPKWYDKEKFDRGREFFHQFTFVFPASMLLGLIAVFSIPSIIKVLAGTRRSNSVYTAYRRYLSTLLHTISWFEHELTPGSRSWRSLETVRSRHLRASLASKSRGIGIVSQRDIALTQYGFIAYAMLKPDTFGIRQTREGDWECYNHFWKVIGHMIGLEDKYNICRDTADETREVLQQLQDRVFIPCLENVPEYFEHLARVMLDGMWLVNPTVDNDALIYSVKHLSGVPGYIYYESERQQFQRRLKQALKDKPLDTGVDVTELMCKPAVEGLPNLPPRKLYYHDFHTIDTVPSYKALNFKSKLKLYLNNLYISIYSSMLGRWYFNLNFKFSLLLMKYFPYMAFFKFGIKSSIVNIFEEDPKDDAVPKKNEEYYKNKIDKPWYKLVLEIFW